MFRCGVLKRKAQPSVDFSHHPIPRADGLRRRHPDWKMHWSGPDMRWIAVRLWWCRRGVPSGSGVLHTVYASTLESLAEQLLEQDQLLIRRSAD